MNPADDSVIPPADRFLGLDLARVAAALCIVALHVFDVSVAAGKADAATVWMVAVGLRWTIPFFFILAGFFHGTSHTASSREWLDARCGRLLRVFAAWTAIYFFFEGTQSAGQVKLSMRIVRLLINGQTYYTLWFLGALIVCTALAWLVLRHLDIHALLALGIGCAVAYVGAIAFSSFLGPLGEYVRSQAGFWWYSTPLYWLAFYAVGVWLGRTGARTPRARRIMVLGAVIAVVLVGIRVAAVAYGNSVSSPLVQTLDTLSFGTLGIVMALGALNLLMRGSTRRVLWLTALPLGIYLMHPLVLDELLPHITPSWLLSHGALLAGAWDVVIASGLCAIATFVITRFKPLRQFL